METDFQQYLLAQRLSYDQKKQLTNYQQKVKQFLQNHMNKGVFLITSGGTSVPLQQRAVRFLQNFSTGLRGSLLAEQVLESSQPLIYFYRESSHIPFSKGTTFNNLILSQDENQIEMLKTARENLKKYRNNFLFLPFKTIYFYLNGLLILKKLLPSTSVLVLCAAVSDFIPKQVSAHKIHTCQQFNLQLMNSPKILRKIAEGKQHLCVSFKLQTDPDKLKQRVNFALQKYGVDLIIGNVLGDKSWVNVAYNMQNFSEQFKNSSLFKGKKDGQPEAFIIKTIREARKHKFKL